MLYSFPEFLTLGLHKYLMFNAKCLGVYIVHPSFQEQFLRNLASIMQSSQPVNNAKLPNLADASCLKSNCIKLNKIN